MTAKDPTRQLIGGMEALARLAGSAIERQDMTEKLRLSTTKKLEEAEEANRTEIRDLTTRIDAKNEAIETLRKEIETPTDERLASAEETIRHLKASIETLVRRISKYEAQLREAAETIREQSPPQFPIQALGTNIETTLATDGPKGPRPGETLVSEPNRDADAAIADLCKPANLENLRLAGEYDPSETEEIEEDNPTESIDLADINCDREVPPDICPPGEEPEEVAPAEAEDRQEAE